MGVSLRMGPITSCRWSLLRTSRIWHHLFKFEENRVSREGEVRERKVDSFVGLGGGLDLDGGSLTFVVGFIGGTCFGVAVFEKALW